MLITHIFCQTQQFFFAKSTLSHWPTPQVNATLYTKKIICKSFSDTPDPKMESSSIGIESTKLQ